MNITEQIIRESIAEVQRRGFTVRMTDFVDGRSCCPIGAMALCAEERQGGFVETAAKTLGVNEEWVWDFVRGFEAWPETHETNGYVLGRLFRRELL